MGAPDPPTPPPQQQRKEPKADPAPAKEDVTKKEESGSELDRLRGEGRRSTVFSDEEKDSDPLKIKKQSLFGS